MLQMLRSLCRQLVNPHATIRGRNVPLGFHQLFLEKPLESRIERAFFDLKQIVGRALNMLCEGIAVQCLLRRIIISNAPGKRSRCSRFFTGRKFSPFQVSQCCSRPRATWYKDMEVKRQKKWKHVER